jgi:hypothetical protein
MTIGPDLCGGVIAAVFQIGSVQRFDFDVAEEHRRGGVIALQHTFRT